MFKNDLLTTMASQNHWDLFIQQGVSIIPEHKLCYIEVSKCACTQVKTMLADIALYPAKFDRSLSAHMKQNSSLKSVVEIGEGAVVEALTSPDYYRFTAVRNPFDRLVSAYNDKILNAVSIPGNKRYVATAKKIKAEMIGAHFKTIDLTKTPVSFTEFVRFISLQDTYDMDRHWYPMTDSNWFDHVNFDHVIKTENLADGMEAVLKSAGINHIKLDTKETANRVSKSKPFSSYYTPETLKIAKRLYKHDFRNFDYDIDALDDEVLGTPRKRAPKAFTAADLPSARRQAAIETPRKPITFIATGIARETPLYDLVSSVAEHFPTAETIIAWQGTASPEMQAFFAKYPKATLYEIDEDAGLSKARNFLVKKVKTDYFCLCDDDFIFRSADGIDLGAALLDAEPEIGVVGGQLTNFNYDIKGNLTGTTDVTYASRMAFDRQAGALQNISIDLLKETVYQIGTETYQLCDIVLNFAIMRKSLFKGGQNAWDETMKISGEHVDFYLQNLTNPMYKTAYLPLMHCEHHRVQTAEYQSLRSRRDGLQNLYAKWGIKIESKLPGFVRTISPEEINLRKLQEPDAVPKTPAIVSAKPKPGGKPIHAILMPFNRCGASLLFKSFNSEKIAKASNLFKGKKVRTGPLDEKYLTKYLSDKTHTTALVTDIYADNPKFEQTMAFLLQHNTKFIILDRRDVLSVAASIIAQKNKASAEKPANVDPADCADLALRYAKQRKEFTALMRKHKIDAPKFDYKEISANFMFAAKFVNKYFNLPGPFTNQEPPKEMKGDELFENWDDIRDAYNKAK